MNSPNQESPMQYPPKAPSPWPPRVNFVMINTAEGYELDYIFPRQENCGHPVGLYLSKQEHTHLLAEAVREAKAQVWEEAAHASLSIVDMEYYDYCRQKASELRKGATPENGGKDG